jgi:hypothetical protein
LGQQQIILVILGVIIIGLAMSVGLIMFSSGNVQANKDAMINDINNLAGNAFQFRIRPRTMGGGGCGTFAGWVIPKKMKSNENGSYSASGGGPTGVVISAKSADDSSNTIKANVGFDGRVTSMAFGGDFQ